MFNYRPGETRKVAGVLTSITFVPKNFSLRTKEEIEKALNTFIVGAEPNESDSPPGKEVDDMLLQSIRDSLRKPQPGESRVVGKVVDITCERGGMSFHVATAGGKKMFRTTEPHNMRVVMYGASPKLDFGCGKVPDQNNAVVTFTTGVDLTGNSGDGKIVSLEFVPTGFKLD